VNCRKAAREAALGRARQKKHISALKRASAASALTQPESYSKIRFADF
jgi:hypothetical protein